MLTLFPPRMEAANLTAGYGAERHMKGFKRETCTIFVEGQRPSKGVTTRVTR